MFQTPDPVFERTWVFVAPSYDAVVTVDLVDASTDRPAGRFETTVMALLQVVHADVDVDIRCCCMYGLRVFKFTVR